MENVTDEIDRRSTLRVTKNDTGRNVQLIGRRLPLNERTDVNNKDRGQPKFCQLDWLCRSDEAVTQAAEEALKNNRGNT